MLDVGIPYSTKFFLMPSLRDQILTLKQGYSICRTVRWSKTNKKCSGYLNAFITLQITDLVYIFIYMDRSAFVTLSNTSDCSVKLMCVLFR